MENNIKNNIGIKNIGINKSDDVKNNNGKINETIYEFLKKYGIKTNNPIYLRGFTHSSYAKQRKIEDYEKLEFLGDAILEFCVSKYIYKNFNSLNVGEMSKKRMLLTQGTTLSSCFKTFNLDKEIKIINLPNNQIPNRIYEDLYESLIGCLFLDKGINVCQQFIEQTLIKFSFLNKDEIIDDYKTKLQELSFVKFKSLPKYVEDKKNKIYFITIFIGKIKYFTSSNKSKREAEKECARKTYEFLVNR